MDTVDRIAESAREWAATTGPFETRGEFGGGGREVWVVGEQQSAVAHVTRRHDDAGPPEVVAAHIAAALNAVGGHGETELPTLDDLARQQGVGPCMDPAALVVPGIENEVALEAIRHPDLWLSAVPIHPEVLYNEAMRTGVARCLDCCAPFNTCCFWEKSDEERRTCAEWTPAPAPEEES
jgi:hypothetical protein